MKYLRYLKYVLRHRWFVFVECCKLGVFWRGLTHDLSKFRPSEWFPYVEYFEGPTGVKRGPNCDEVDRMNTKAAFDVAWLKHINRNPHHWQYWRLREDDGDTKVLDMPRSYLLEMLADWRGAARAQGYDSIGPWYDEHYLKIDLENRTRNRLHSHLREYEFPRSMQRAMRGENPFPEESEAS